MNRKSFEQKGDLEGSHTIKNIVGEIEREFLRTEHAQADKSLVTFYVKLLLFNPKWQIDGHVLLARDNIQIFINYVVDNLKCQNEPDMVTINIQNCLFSTFHRRYEILKERKKDTVQRLSPLKHAILEQNSTIEDLTNVFHRILVYCIFVSGMGNPLEPEVYKQSRSVLRSILTMDEIREFLHRPYVIRLDELGKLVKVYTGIRIYNKDCDKGGDGVPDVLKILFTALDGLEDFLLHLFHETSEKIEILTGALTSCYIPLVMKRKICLKLNLPENECLFEEDVEYCKHLVLVYKQFQEVIQFILFEVMAIEKKSRQAEANFYRTLEHLRATVVPNFYIHVNLVFQHCSEDDTYDVETSIKL